MRKILLVSASPNDRQQISTGDEIHKIKQVLNDSYNCKVINRATEIDFIQNVCNFKPYIIHFSGHGEGKKGILFEDENGNATHISSKDLFALFGFFKSATKLVFLNACRSIEQAESIVENIDFVIAWNSEPDDTAAVFFAENFYKGLGEGKSISSAFIRAKNELESDSRFSNISGNISILERKSQINTISEPQDATHKIHHFSSSASEKSKQICSFFVKIKKEGNPIDIGEDPICIKEFVEECIDLEDFCFHLRFWKNERRYMYDNLSGDNKSRKAISLVSVALQYRELGEIVVYLVKYWIEKLGGNWLSLVEKKIHEQLWYYCHQDSYFSEPYLLSEAENLLNGIMFLITEYCYINHGNNIRGIIHTRIKNRLIAYSIKLKGNDKLISRVNDLIKSIYT